MKRIGGYVRLTRPVNAVICALSVFCGSVIRGKPLDTLPELVALFHTSPIPAWVVRSWAAALSASLILAAGNTYNDVRDLVCDSVNAPERPLPSGAVSAAGATVFSGILALVGIALSLVLGWGGVLIALAAAVTLVAYDIRLKGVPLAGNITVACLGGLAFVYGGLAGGASAQALVPALFAVLFHLGRELIKDAADVEGDTIAGIRTSATVWGIRTACRAAAFVLGLLVIVTALPVVSGYFGPGYGAFIVIGVWPPVLYSIVVGLGAPDKNKLASASLYLKLAMPAGITAVLVGFQGW